MCISCNTGKSVLPDIYARRPIIIETSYPKPTIKAFISSYKYRDLSTIFIKEI